MLQFLKTIIINIYIYIGSSTWLVNLNLHGYMHVCIHDIHNLLDLILIIQNLQVFKYRVLVWWSKYLLSHMWFGFALIAC